MAAALRSQTRITGFATEVEHIIAHGTADAATDPLSAHYLSHLLRWFAYAGDDGICGGCRARLSPHSVSNVLGERRNAPHVYPDGAWSCPFCGSACVPTERWFEDPCLNPQCEANPHMSAAVVLERRAQFAERKREEDRRRRNHELAMQRIQADKERRAAELREVREAGLCVECYVRRYGKRVRHRTADYHESRR